MSDNYRILLLACALVLWCILIVGLEHYRIHELKFGWAMSWPEDFPIGGMRVWSIPSGWFAQSEDGCAFYDQAGHLISRVDCRTTIHPTLPQWKAF